MKNLTITLAKKWIYAIFIFLFFIVIGTELLYQSDRGYAFLMSMGIKIDSFHDRINILKYLKKYQQKNIIENKIKLNINSGSFDVLNSQKQEFIELGYYPDRLKKWMKSTIIVREDPFDVKAKIHGTSVSPLKKYNKYSYKIKSKIKVLDRKRFSLILSAEFNPVNIVAQSIASSFDLLAPKGEMALVSINNADFECFYMEEAIKKRFLKKHGFRNYVLVKPNDDHNRKEASTGQGHRSGHDMYHGNMEYSGPENLKAVAAKEFDRMSKALSLKDGKKLASYFNIDYMGRFLAVKAIFNDCHSILGDNLRLMYSHDDKKFYPIFRQESKGDFPKHNSFLYFDKNIF